MASVAVVVLSVVACGAIPRAASAIDCPSGASTGAKPILLVETSKHALTLCEAGNSVETFSVRIGKNGTGKTREGDGKTPLGLYGLGEPRPSAAFGTFVPVDYPTADQRSAGYTGGAIGVHGPHRGVRWAGSLVNLFDLTDGCVGIATDAEMDRIADWIRAHQAHAILLK